MAGLLKSNVFWEKTVFSFLRGVVVVLSELKYTIDIKELFPWNQ